MILDIIKISENIINIYRFIEKQKYTFKKVFQFISEFTGICNKRSKLPFVWDKAAQKIGATYGIPHL